MAVRRPRWGTPSAKQASLHAPAAAAARGHGDRWGAMRRGRGGYMVER
jgi:hypothetical protein